MAGPAVSVLIIVHNRAHTIGAAVRSVLQQTLRDFELVVVDDGSTDGTAEVVAGFDDPRLRLVTTTLNQGIPLARNRALGEATGKYIAWLDSDDLCHPERLRVQHDFLERHPRIDMIGSAARKIRADGTLMKAGRVPFRCHEEIRALLLFRSAFQQSSIFGRSESIKAVPYDPAFPVCEDVDMFARFTDQYRAENLPRFLIARRIHAGQTIRSNVERIIDRQMAISARKLARLGMSHDEAELRKHVILGGSFDNQISDELIDWSEGWFDRIRAANRARHCYEEAALKPVFDLIVMKAALRRVMKDPSRIGRLARLAARHPRGLLALAKDAALPLLPIGGQPSAAGLRPLLRA
ncbi:glycosyltransferase family 2 protein [Sphingomonas glaciei]|uniref:Glycosyltransferase family 2 protein n=1 Tax=Sphingomonas glaciei TaxID=2938948 RepID=A0ABY5MWM0_9SPHN|nr:glycosyltransferase family A protein [Sphingomonas glaciei]UUR08663.1 glycosyltransferase family 2 protein [Sphingomonas glaciei]